ncbi:hypothetical protein CSUI_002628 [Cystoisospora suis]|uniref:Uncharacterized protein n=1 Tax=Cystoisospora suis TaxID=483139 RepID=A0A2C6KHK8_9APIC|nr:hypothetical protein CSUI_002628 [Cystoisospora suis]
MEGLESDGGVSDGSGRSVSSPQEELSRPAEERKRRPELLPFSACPADCRPDACSTAAVEYFSGHGRKEEAAVELLPQQSPIASSAGVRTPPSLSAISPTSSHWSLSSSSIPSVPSPLSAPSSSCAVPFSSASPLSFFPSDAPEVLDPCCESPRLRFGKVPTGSQGAPVGSRVAPSGPQQPRTLLAGKSHHRTRSSSFDSPRRFSSCLSAGGDTEAGRQSSTLHASSPANGGVPGAATAARALARASRFRSASGLTAAERGLSSIGKGKSVRGVSSTSARKNDCPSSTSRLPACSGVNKPSDKFPTPSTSRPVPHNMSSSHPSRSLLSSQNAKSGRLGPAASPPARSGSGVAPRQQTSCQRQQETHSSQGQPHVVPTATRRRPGDTKVSTRPHDKTISPTKKVAGMLRRASKQSASLASSRNSTLTKNASSSATRGPLCDLKAAEERLTGRGRPSRSATLTSEEKGQCSAVTRKLRAEQAPGSSTYLEKGPEGSAPDDKDICVCKEEVKKRENARFLLHEDQKKEVEGKAETGGGKDRTGQEEFFADVVEVHSEEEEWRENNEVKKEELTAEKGEVGSECPEPRHESSTVSRRSSFTSVITEHCANSEDEQRECEDRMLEPQERQSHDGSQRQQEFAVASPMKRLEERGERARSRKKENLLATSDGDRVIQKEYQFVDESTSKRSDEEGETNEYRRSDDRLLKNKTYVHEDRQDDKEEAKSNTKSYEEADLVTPVTRADVQAAKRLAFEQDLQLLATDCRCGAASELFKFFKGEVERDRRRIEELQRHNEALESRLKEHLPLASLLECEDIRLAISKLLKAKCPEDVLQSMNQQKGSCESRKDVLVANVVTAKLPPAPRERIDHEGRVSNEEDESQDTKSRADSSKEISCEKQQTASKGDIGSLKSAVFSRVVEEWNGRRRESSLMSSKHCPGMAGVAGVETSERQGAHFFSAKEIRETLESHLQRVLRERQEETEREARSLKMRAKHATVGVTVLQRRDARLQAEIQALQHQVKALEEQVQSLRIANAEKQASRARRAAQLREVQQLREELRQRRKATEKSAEALKNKLRAAVSDLRAVLEAKRRQSEEQEEEAKRIEARSQAMREEVNRLLEEEDRMREHHEELAKTDHHLDNAIEAEEKKIRDLEKEMRHLCKGNDEANTLKREETTDAEEDKHQRKRVQDLEMRYKELQQRDQALDRVRFWWQRYAAQQLEHERMQGQIALKLQASKLASLRSRLLASLRRKGYPSLRLVDLASLFASSSCCPHPRSPSLTNSTPKSSLRPSTVAASPTGVETAVVATQTAAADASGTGASSVSPDLRGSSSGSSSAQEERQQATETLEPSGKNKGRIPRGDDRSIPLRFSYKGSDEEEATAATPRSELNSSLSSSERGSQQEEKNSPVGSPSASPPRLLQAEEDIQATVLYLDAREHTCHETKDPGVPASLSDDALPFPRCSLRVSQTEEVRESFTRGTSPVSLAESHVGVLEEQLSEVIWTKGKERCDTTTDIVDFVYTDLDGNASDVCLSNPLLALPQGAPGLLVRGSLSGRCSAMFSGSGDKRDRAVTSRECNRKVDGKAAEEDESLFEFLLDSSDDVSSVPGHRSSTSSSGSSSNFSGPLFSCVSSPSRSSCDALFGERDSFSARARRIAAYVGLSPSCRTPEETSSPEPSPSCVKLKKGDKQASPSASEQSPTTASLSCGCTPSPCFPSSETLRSEEERRVLQSAGSRIECSGESDQVRDLSPKASLALPAQPTLGRTANSEVVSDTQPPSPEEGVYSSSPHLQYFAEVATSTTRPTTTDDESSGDWESSLQPPPFHSTSEALARLIEANVWERRTFGSP